MGKSLVEIAQTLKDADKKAQLIYALMALVKLDYQENLRN